MIEFKHGDILSEKTEAVVNTVNCVGIMGRGIALQFKKAFPDNFKAYESACRKGEVTPGRLFIFETGAFTNPRLIINFPTKRHWKEKSRLEDIDSGLIALKHEILARRVSSIAIPPLGCGLGGLDWAEVRPRIVEALKDLAGVQVLIYEPGGAPAAERVDAWALPPRMTPGRAALVALMDRYVGGLLDPFVTLLEVHKLMYFMQAAGQPLRLVYKKGPFGPYAENLRHVLAAIEGHFVTGYADGGDSPVKRIEVMPAALREAEATLRSDHPTHERFDRVSDLVQGFESPFGMELLATVHWVITQEGATTAEEVVHKVHAWGRQKEKFTPRQINLAADVLIRKGWASLMVG